MHSWYRKSKYILKFLCGEKHALIVEDMSTILHGA